MRLLILLFLVLGVSSCMPMTGGQAPLDFPPPQKITVQKEVDLFLSTTVPAVESAVLSRLKESQVSNKLIKSILQESPLKTAAKTGLQTDLEKNLNGKNYPYALYVPESAQAGNSLPLIVILHGMGGSGGNTIPAWMNRLGEEFIILCPSYPMGAWWAQPAEDLVLQLIQEVQAEYRVDTNRIFLAGLSNGAIGAYMIGMFYPDRFAGIVPIASGITPRYMHFLVNLKNTPIYIIQGVYDPVFPIQLTRRVHKILTDMKYPVVYREHDEKGSAHGGHFLPDAEVPPLVAWLKKQNRALSPQVVRMTREANHLERIHWVRLSKGLQMAALQLPGPEKEPVHVQDGKIATLFATQNGNNEFSVMGKNLVEFELFFNTDMVDFDAPVRVFTQKLREEAGKIVTDQKQESFNSKLVKDLEVLLRGFKQYRDPAMLFDAKITISLNKTFAGLIQQ
jgi:predicted esterase